MPREQEGEVGAGAGRDFAAQADRADGAALGRFVSRRPFLENSSQKSRGEENQRSRGQPRQLVTSPAVGTEDGDGEVAARVRGRRGGRGW